MTIQKYKAGSANGEDRNLRQKTLKLENELQEQKEIGRRSRTLKVLKLCGCPRKHVTFYLKC